MEIGSRIKQKLEEKIAQKVEKVKIRAKEDGDANRAGRKGQQGASRKCQT